MDSLPNFVTHGALLRALRARELRYNLRSITWTVHLKAQRLNLSYFYGLVVPSSRTEAGMKINIKNHYYYLIIIIIIIIITIIIIIHQCFIVTHLHSSGNQNTEEEKREKRGYLIT